MTQRLPIALLLLFSVGSTFAFTGFGESGTFAITDDTLPVELSSFSAIATESNFVQLDWVTQSETGVSGYYVYRNTSNRLDNAMAVSPLVTAGNTSQQQSYSYTDSEVAIGTWYYWLQAREMNGSMNFHGPISVTLNSPGEGENLPIIPITTRLLPNYPNPFNPNTSIRYQLKTPGTVSLSIYNTRGQLMRSYMKTHAAAGTFSVMFDGTDTNGEALSSGIYYCVMKAGKYNATIKMVLLK